jgi:hypothetical protein
LREGRLYSGAWHGNLGHRKARVRSILRFIARTFDAGKCANGSVNVGKYDAWARAEEGTIVELAGGIHVGPEFVAVFLAVCEFALIDGRNTDSTLPHKRAEELWKALHNQGVIDVRFCARKWAVCREEMARHGIVQITDRSYGPGKAMGWAVGCHFPFLSLWKTPKVRSLQGPGRATTQQHNTLLRQQSAGSSGMALTKRSRPPPATSLALV